MIVKMMIVKMMNKYYIKNDIILINQFVIVLLDIHSLNTKYKLSIYNLYLYINIMVFINNSQNFFNTDNIIYNVKIIDNRGHNNNYIDLSPVIKAFNIYITEDADYWVVTDPPTFTFLCYKQDFSYIYDILNRNYIDIKYSHFHIKSK